MRAFLNAPALAAVSLSLAAVTFAQTPPVLRPSPEVNVVEPSGKQVTLSSQKGKVVVLDFIFTTCVHCQAETVMLEKLYKEMAPKGLQILSVAINDNAMMLIPGFVQQYNVPWPVGYAPSDTMLKYMGFSMMDRWVVPQVVVIDRKGMIRAQTPVPGDINLQSETYMRGLLGTLLAEKAPAHTSHARGTVKTASNH
ncbi:MAG TPA: TlpA disulfide reductase family protein [Bryobacteraceae bacterium]|nr:TlpA disulfide reductase family protein [Bryobacteraceae bacterium]